MIRRGIVIVHGVGRQGHGAELDTQVEPLVEYLGTVIGYENVQVVARAPRDASGTARARIHLRAPGRREPLEEWEVREAWWAQIFPPTGRGVMLAWAVRAFWAVFQAAFVNVGWRNLKRVLRRDVRPQGEGVWRTAVTPAPFPAVDVLNWIVIMAGYSLVFLLGLVVVPLLYVFLLLPSFLLYPAFAQKAQAYLVDLFVGSIAEQQGITSRYVAVADAASVVTLALKPFLDPALLEQKGRHYETVTVIAHSAGCVVSYDALVSGAVPGWLRSARDRRLTWITVGSGLNLGWRMHTDRHARDRAFWRRCLPGNVNWINIYARYDPVPGGEPPRALVAALARLEPRPYVSIRVANEDWPLSDHTSYWDNADEVTSRLVHAIGDSRLGRQSLAALLDGSYNPESLVDRGVKRSVDHGPRHRAAVSGRRGAQIGAAAAVVGLLIGFSGTVERFGRWLSDRLSDVPPHSFWTWLRANLPHRVPWLHVHDLPHFLLGAAMVLYALVIAGLLANLLGSLFAWLRPEPDRIPQPLAAPSSDASSAGERADR
ncbi:MAG TPA: hypothetical protein VFA70_09170 [Dehalococcoidia bacterium]|jgi:hypothetical protein|nr:hypothetical protein [Dehalococcoidia bacterium]